MFRRIIPVIGVVAAVGCGPSPQQFPSPDASVVLMGSPPIYALLGYREELRLEPNQISALDSIAQQLQREEAPLVEGSRPSRRTRSNRPPLADKEEISQFQALQASRERAVQGVRKVLNPEQQTEVCTRFRESAAEDRDRRSATPGPRGRSGDTRARLPSGEAIWPWCGKTGSSATRP